MDEEKQELPVVGADGVQTPRTEEAEKKPSQKAPDRTRQTIFYGAAGVYLIYLSVQLFRDLFAAGRTGWDTERVVCTVGAVVFALFGAGLLVRIGLRLKREYDAKKSGDENQ